MSSLVFVHDGPVFFDADRVFYEYAYHKLYERYSYLADRITFLMRAKPLNQQNKFTPLDSRINVVEVPNFKGAKVYLSNRKRAEKIVEKCVTENDMFVLRLQSSIAEIALKYIKKYNKPYIVEIVGCPWDSYWNHSLLGKMVAPYAYFKTKSIIKKAPFVYYVTEEFLQNRYPCDEKAVSVSCSNVVLDDMDLSALNKRLKKIDNSEDSRKLTLGTAAAIDTRYKGQEYVIRAIPKLEELGYSVEYFLAGGKNRNEADNFLKNLAEKLGVSERVKFLGALSAKEMPAFYDSLDIYVQPSKQEGLPRSVIEAMSRGCPVIGSDIAGIPELIQDRYLFKKGSVESLIRALTNLLADNKSDVCIANFNKAKEYDADLLTKRRLKFYDIFLASLKHE